MQVLIKQLLPSNLQASVLFFSSAPGSKPKMGYRFQAFLYLPILLLQLFLFLQRGRAEEELWYNGSNSSSSGAQMLRSRCNLFQGSWVFDASYPLYSPFSCPFIDPEFNCQKYGRPDKMYLKYRWKPSGCDLPRFNGLEFLMRWRGKKIMFVGDSLSLNQWESLNCLIHASVPKARFTVVKRGTLSSVTFEDYRLTVLLYRTPYLVDLVREKVGLVLKIDSIRNGDAWKGMDMLIFNSWHWWTHTGRSQPWNYIQEGNKLYKDMNRLVAYYKGLTTWARWVNRNVDPTKTKVFFQGISPTHYMGKEWNEPAKSCYGEMKPLTGYIYPGGIPAGAIVVNKVLSRIKKPVYLLDVTRLSQLRKDAHPSTYSGGHSNLDCSHWCLPGLPDTWNQLLYAALGL